MIIRVVPRKWFEDRKGTEEEKKIFSEHNVISIITPEHKPTGFKKEGVPFTKSYRRKKNVLVLNFHDAHAPGEDVILMSDEDAMNVKKFVDKMDKTKSLIVHCTAGKSRSYTTGFCLSIYFNRILEDNMKDYIWFKDNNRGYINSWVRKKLFRVFGIENKER